jgi:alcohol dehydrogenase/propanol-preferring alcohol dehydrogenase
MSTVRSMIVEAAGQPFTGVDRPLPSPGPGQVRVKVQACGVCHSDAFVKEGQFPGVTFPRAPGHEVVGSVDAVGDGVQGFAVGDRVGVGWHGGHCFHCSSCRQGDFMTCVNEQITGIAFDGGYQEAMIAPAEALARVPDGISSEEAAPLLCAGITVYNALRHAPARPGDLVAVQGIGGLGHLGVQFARHMGFRVAAISRGADKADFAHQLGAHEYVDATAGDPAEALQRMGGARVVLATAPNSRAMSQLVGGLGIEGQLLVVGASAEPIEVSPFALIGARRSVKGWPSGTATDSEDTLNFALQTGIRPMIETYPLAEANQAYERMITNQARFRVVLQMS